MVTNEDRDLLNDLFMGTNVPGGGFDTADDILETPTLVINLEEVENQATKRSTRITELLSKYYFDQKYIDEHPYIPDKIMQEMDNIRMLYKMLYVNEKAQDTLIQNITMNSGKGALYQSLTSLQKSMLDIQKQLNDLIASIENIFKEMQANAEQTFMEKPKETNMEDGSMVVRGAKEFIEFMMKKRQESESAVSYKMETLDGEKVDLETGEVLAEDVLAKELAV